MKFATVTCAARTWKIRGSTFFLGGATVDEGAVGAGRRGVGLLLAINCHATVRAATAPPYT